MMILCTSICFFACKHYFKSISKTSSLLKYSCCFYLRFRFQNFEFSKRFTSHLVHGCICMWRGGYASSMISLLSFINSISTLRNFNFSFCEEMLKHINKIGLFCSIDCQNPVVFYTVIGNKQNKKWCRIKKILY